MSRLQDEDAVARAGARAARMRRGMYVLPSLFTAGSIGAGYFAITQTMESMTAIQSSGEHLDWAAKAICFAIPFDALDGRIARMTNTTSEFGKELDSLADAITFGVAPALLAFAWGFHSLPETPSPELHHLILQVGSFVCFLFLLCGVSRLARFNISHDAKPRNPGRQDRKYFVGMPIPAAAGMIASTVYCCNGYTIPNRWLAMAWIVLVGLLGFLMVCTWRFWSGKEINLARTQPFQLLVVLAIVLFILIRFSRGALFLMALTYMFSGIWARAAYSWSRRRRQIPRGAVAEERYGPPMFTGNSADPHADMHDTHMHGDPEAWQERGPEPEYKQGDLYTHSNPERNEQEPGPNGY
ncbi:CDP-alcohol phosphatidyltransferase family protein [Acidicapsa ligni]|uniref:CDP-alcohol phosphatidyltransferase family protein n=1 Tax=Acidicapsa ligni TaxID=542300 RepID=UPI0021E078BA|nr:phosphatidylcholine/phosphatidylserine synthase [Acidicapsa ligni]